MKLSLLFTVLLPILAAAIWFWNGWLRRIPLAEFGVENVQRVLRFELPDYRDAVWKRGWMTSHEWIVLNKRQITEMSAELKRRGLE